MNFFQINNIFLVYQYFKKSFRWYKQLKRINCKNLFKNSAYLLDQKRIIRRIYREQFQQEVKKEVCIKILFYFSRVRMNHPTHPTTLPSLEIENTWKKPKINWPLRESLHHFTLSSYRSLRFLPFYYLTDGREFVESSLTTRQQHGDYNLSVTDPTDINLPSRGTSSRIFIQKNSRSIHF